jgi:predicted hydrocarbon binding protein
MTSQTPPAVTLDGEVIAFGRRGLIVLRQALARDGGDGVAAAFQEAGYAAGDQVYDLFRRWARGWTGVDDPGQLDATALGECLGTFFEGLGWGMLSVAPVGRSGLTLHASDWAEADPAAGGELPTCFFSAGLLSGVLGHLAERDVAVMEVECRSRGDERCRFLAGSPDALQAAYERLAAGEPWEAALS